MLCPEDDTDGEQEDLPFDEDLQNVFQHNCYSQSLEDLTSLEKASQDVFTLIHSHMTNHSKETADCKIQLAQTEINLSSLLQKKGMEFNSAEKECVSNSEGNHYMSTSVISDVLLRHFPKEGLSGSCQLIDSETIPEISFTESFDETILNQVKTSESTRLSSQKEEGENNLECCNFETEAVCESVDKNWNVIKDTQYAVAEIVTLKCNKKDFKEGNPECLSQGKPVVNEDLNYFSNPKEECKEQNPVLETTPSCLKYGQQHHVHYRLPDFSKVAPRVKIPKGNSQNSSPIIKKNKLSADLLGKSATVKDVLESMNYLETAAIKNKKQEVKIPEFDQQLEFARQSPLDLPFVEKVPEEQTLSQMLRQRTEELRTKVIENAFLKNIYLENSAFFLYVES
uniref:Uncharacterized protein n=1 Tax=Salvator merianae TaxID=96440 RepID=A0A8D0C808_SALMN